MQQSRRDWRTWYPPFTAVKNRSSRSAVISRRIVAGYTPRRAISSAGSLRSVAKSWTAVPGCSVSAASTALIAIE